jgi:hypothetical protein
MSTIRRLLGKAFVRSGLQQVFVENATAGVDNSGLWPVGGLFAPVASAARAPVGAAFCSRPRTGCYPARWRSLDADAD